MSMTELNDSNQDFKYLIHSKSLRIPVALALSFLGFVLSAIYSRAADTEVYKLAKTSEPQLSQ